MLDLKGIPANVGLVLLRDHNCKVGLEVPTAAAPKEPLLCAERECPMPNEDPERTMIFPAGDTKASEAREILGKVYEALREKGYNPIGQLAGFLLSGDPVYITAHKDARSLIRRLDRMEVLEELVRFYLNYAMADSGK